MCKIKSRFKSRLSVLILVALVAVSAGSISAGVPEAVTYLEAETANEWITMALAAAGQSSVSTAHLTSVSGTLATDYAKAILALTAVGENPATFGNTD